MSFWRIVLKSLWRHRLSSLLALVSIALGVALLVSVVAVREESGLLAGHNTIGIDETSTTGADFLRFTTLEQWAFDAKAPSPCPPSVRAWSGRSVACLGFMYPLEPGAELKTFCLLRTPQTCCYGPRPQYSQYLLVEMKTPVKLERLRPVLVRGRFVADAQPEQGFICRLEGQSCVKAGDAEPDVDPAASARQAGLPLVDFAWLAAAATTAGKRIPSSLTAVDGMTVVVAGYFFDGRPGSPPRLLIGRNWWDGVSQGVRPCLSNALAAYLRDARQMPPLWRDRGVMTGVLRLERDPRRWAEQGIASLNDAVQGVPGTGGQGVALGRGPVLAPWHEAFLTATLVYVLLRQRQRVRARTADHDSGQVATTVTAPPADGSKME
jgi:hypothetical protein